MWRTIQIRFVQVESKTDFYDVSLKIRYVTSTWESSDEFHTFDIPIKRMRNNITSSG